MTREEAIEILNRDDDSMRKGYFCINDFTAIEVLKSEEPCEDCVSKQSMLDAITEIDDNTNMDIYTNEVREIIGALPSITPTRKKGKWIERELVQCHIRGDRKILVCSNCNLGIANGILGFANFCPTCGADMRGNKE